MVLYQPLLNASRAIFIILYSIRIPYHNIIYLGANQVILNLILGRVFEANILILAPKMGPFAIKFIESGAAIRVSEECGQLLAHCLKHIRDVFLVICNTLMTAPQILEMASRPQPTM